MEYINLLNSDLKVSRLCMGGCPMGQYGWGNVSELELIESVHTAVDIGINLFDTADAYGLGKSEETLGKAIGKKRKEVCIASKFGVRVENGHTYYDNSSEWIEKALTESLKRLKTDYIDLYQVHYRDEKTPIAEVIETLEKLKNMGYIRHYGFSNIHRQDFLELKAYVGKFVSVQNEFSLACRKNEADLIFASKYLMSTPMTWGSLGQGVLTGKYGKDSVFSKDDRRSRDIYVNFHGETFLKNLEIVEAMRPVAAAHNVSIASVAVRFIMDYIKDSVVLVGAKRASQILCSSEACGWELTEEELSTLEKVSKIQ